MILLFTMSIPFFWYLGLVLKNDVTRLKDQYVKTSFSGDVHYTIQKNKPKSWVTLNSISKHAKNAIVISEDWGFFQHNGVDFEQIKEAVKDAGDGKKLRGASTISQQLIKNIFLSSERSFTRKFKEIILVREMEDVVSKEKILETYLNVVEFGEGIYGINAASKYYFNKKPSELTPRESAFLAMLLPSPKKYSISFKEKKMSEFANETVNDILYKMAIAGHLPKEALDLYKNEKFQWEKSLDKIDNMENNDGNNKTNKKSHNIEEAKLKNYEDRYRNDKDLQLDENLEYDDDAIIEDTSGLKEEFSVE